MDAAFVGMYSQKLTENSNLAPDNHNISYVRKHSTPTKHPIYGLMPVKFYGGLEHCFMHTLQYLLNMNIKIF